MRIASSAFLIGAASAATFQNDAQHVLSSPKGTQQTVTSPKGWANQLKQLESAWGTMTSDAKAIWDELGLFVPNSMDQIPHLVKPKKHTRIPDHEWDYVVRGADVQSMWTQEADGERHRTVSGRLENYNLRTRKVDPSILGVDKVKQYSGYLDDEANDKHLFYWFFESRNDPANDPVVLWLNGGPGCSSLTGLFFELGPSSINNKVKVVHNDYAWNANASVIFLDQPVNVGFSYSKQRLASTVAAAKDIYALLTLFFNQFPEYGKQPFHIAGESYAGHYIPVFASEILSHPRSNINLKSVLIGNGLTDPYNQYPEYRPMACGKGGYEAVLDESTCQSMDNALPRCQSLIKGCYESQNVWSCVPATIYCNNALIGPYQRTGKNVYDVRGECEGDSLCYPELKYIDKYLNDKDVQKALGVETEGGYDSCNFDVNRNFLFNGDWMQPFHRLVPKLLEKIPVLIYAGDADYICNWLGNEAWTRKLEWPGQKEFANANITSLSAAGSSKTKEYGKVKSAGNFTFMRIYQAGHMVPHDQPEASLNFLNRWLGGEWYA